jgi:lipopolysaccharide export system protein LptA
MTIFNSRTLSAAAALLLPLAVRAQESPFQISKASTGLELTTPDASSSPKAAAGKAKKKAETSEPKAPTEITAQEETTFDEKERVAHFVGSVVVNDPQFHLSCDRLTAFLKKESPKNEAGAEEAASKPANAPAASGGLERALAEGNVVIIQDKKDEATGEITRYSGKGTHAEYNATTGDMKLSGWPEIRQGLNNQIATSAETVMIMNQAGKLKTIGPSKSVIVDSSDDKKETRKANRPIPIEAKQP